MSQQNSSCRLCVNWGDDFKSLYDENGHPNALYEIIVKYFHPTVLDIKKYIQLTGICQECWHQVWSFCCFQKSVHEAQQKLTEGLSSEQFIIKDEVLDQTLLDIVNQDDLQQTEDHSTVNLVELGDAEGDNSNADAGSTCEEFLEDEYQSFMAAKGQLQQQSSKDCFVMEIEELNDDDDDDDGEDDDGENGGGGGGGLQEICVEQIFNEPPNDVKPSVDDYVDDESCDYQNIGGIEMPSVSNYGMDRDFTPPEIKNFIQIPHEQTQNRSLLNKSKVKGGQQSVSLSEPITAASVSKTPLQCEWCGFHWNSKKDIKIHIATRHTLDTNQCQQCSLEEGSSSSTTSSNDVMDVRLQKINMAHCEKQFTQCIVCNQGFPSLYDLNHHYKIRHSVERQPLKICKTCGHNFDTHIRYGSVPRSGKNVHKYPVGRRSFRVPAIKLLKQSNLFKSKPQETTSSVNNRIYVCSFCNLSMSSSKDFMEHQLKAHPLKSNNKYVKILR